MFLLTPFFNAGQKKSFMWIIFQLPFPFSCLGCNRLVITEKFTRERVLGFKGAVELERGGMSVLPDPLTAADPIPAWLSPAAGDDPTVGGPVGTADTRVGSYTAVRKNTSQG